MFGYYLHLAWRRCRQGPAMVALLVLTMAIGIASCMTAMTVFGALAGDPLPGISEHLYVVSMDAREVGDRPLDDDDDGLHSYLKTVDARALVDAHRTRRTAALAQSMATLDNPDGSHSEHATGLIGYGPLSGLLGVPLRYGRPWTPAEEAARTPVVLIDADIARKLFGRENVVGRTVEMDGHAFRVVGVTVPWHPRTQFFDLSRNVGNVLGQDESFFVPMQAALDADVGPITSGECGKDAAVVSFQSTKLDRCRWLEVWAEADDASQAAAFGTFVDQYGRAQHRAGRFVAPPQAKLYGTAAWMAAHRVVPDDVRLNLALAGAFLLLCLVNVAGLLAARFLRRQSDVAIRRALGASRRELFVQHLVETALLGLGGGVLALPLTLLGLWIVRMQPVAYADAASFSPAVFGGLLALSLLAGLLVGVLPAWRVCRLSPASQIKTA